MADIVGVRFKRAGKVYYFDPAGIDLEVNDYVVVETNRGLELGRVVIAPKQVLAGDAVKSVKPIVRKAGPEDIDRAQEVEAKEREALDECRKLVDKLQLPMKLLSAEYNLDGSRLTIYFSAVERVDFRELVRELANRLKVWVEMRQTGPRDEAKLIGGLGRCGRPLCCSSFLCEFAPVSIRMAKEQNLPLNPMKISGCCGRLMCCLVYENEQYHLMKGKLPKEGQLVSTAMGVAKATVELPLSEITIENEPQRRQEGKKARG
ncbi:MAG: stage 0 sporulation family protein [Chloroflexi bacterium]|nr:stage 0 sporulation family protein [Chloroflexota bacterium]